jgi:hypothetical protein
VRTDRAELAQGDLGLLGITVPHEAGGSGMDATAAVSGRTPFAALRVVSA